jgi:hypothetical protein
MKTSYSRRELYAFGEPIGDSSTYETAGRRIYGGGGGGVLGGISDALSGIDDAIISPVVNEVSNAGSSIDDFVNEEIPGGWALPAIATAAYFGVPVDPSAAGAGSGGGSMFGGLGELFGSGMPELLGEAGGYGAGGGGAFSGLSEMFGPELLGEASGTWASSPGGLSSLGNMGKLFGGGSGGGSGSGGLTLGGAGLGAAGLAGLLSMLKSDSEKYGVPGRQDNAGPMSQFKYDPSKFTANRPDPAMFRPQGAPTAQIGYAGGGPVEQMSNANAIGANTGYPMANINKATYSTPYQTPISQNVIQGTSDTGVNPMTGEQTSFASGGDVQLQGRVTIDDQGGGQGGFGQGANGYQAVGSRIPGFGGGMNQPQGGMMGGLDSRAIAANPQGFQQFMQGAQQQERQRPGSTMFGQFGGAGIGAMNPGLYGGQPQKPSYDQYVAENNRRLAEKSQIGSVASMTHDYVGPTMSRSDFEAFQNAPKNPAAMMAAGGMAYASGGISSLGGYSDGGRLLKGPGDGMSDNIPAKIGAKQPARLADGEFVVPADVVSHLGNGSTDAGAKQLYKMMDRIRSARTGRKAQGKQIKADKFLPK